MTTTYGKAIDALGPGRSTILEKVEFGGGLEARKFPSGNVMFCWRFTEAGRTERVTIGRYDSAAPPKALRPGPRGYSVAAAREAARVLAKANTETPGGLRAERERRQAAEEAARQESVTREKYTLKALCTAYCDLLEKKEKSSHRDARNILENHLFTPYPALARKPAREVEKPEIVAALRRLIEADKKTTARKLRAYGGAAYALAAKADSDATLPEVFIHFRIADNNPFRATAPIKGGEDKNPLSVADLRRYWQALKSEPDVIGAALRLHVVSGAQRVAQLVRLHSSDVRDDTLLLLDIKGKRDKARAHLLPITDAIRAELEKLPAKGYALSTDGGEGHMHATSVSAWAAEVGKRAGIERFQLKRVRSGVETMLAEAGVPLHVRAQLQSHGLGGTQDRHYDDYSYLAEKRAALVALHNLLERTEARNVTPIKGRKKRAA